MAASHDDHAPTLGVPSNRGRLVVALVLTLAFSVVEGVAGWQAGSLALFADAGHMVTDGAALGLAALSAWLAAQPPSVHHSYGWGRAELLSALINALAMLAIVAVIAYEAWQRFNAPLAIEGGTVTVVAVAGLAINLIVARILSQGHDNVNMRAAFVHVLGDILGSIAALVAGLVIWFTGWTPIDPLLSLLIAGIVLSSSFALVREALHGLLDGVPRNVSLPALAQALTGVEGVSAISDLHVWELSAERNALTAQVHLGTLAGWPQTLEALSAVAHGHGIAHCTFQPTLDPGAIQESTQLLCTQPEPPNGRR